MKKIHITTTKMEKIIIEIKDDEEFDSKKGEMENEKTIFMIEEGK